MSPRFGAPDAKLWSPDRALSDDLGYSGRSELDLIFGKLSSVLHEAVLCGD